MTEFWKVQPVPLKDVTERGGGHGKNVVSKRECVYGRLESKVFVGIQSYILFKIKVIMRGDESPPPLEINDRSSSVCKNYEKGFLLQ